MYVYMPDNFFEQFEILVKSFPHRFTKRGLLLFVGGRTIYIKFGEAEGKTEILW